MIVSVGPIKVWQGVAVKVHVAGCSVPWARAALCTVAAQAMVLAMMEKNFMLSLSVFD